MFMQLLKCVVRCWVFLYTVVSLMKAPIKVHVKTWEGALIENENTCESLECLV